MPTLSAWGVRLALGWLAIGALLGALILARVPLGIAGIAVWIPAHAEIMLVGWTMQLAFAVAHWILPRQGAGQGRGPTWPIVAVFVGLDLGLVLVIGGATLAGRILEVAAAVGFALQGLPRIRAAGWGATGKGGDLVRLGRSH